MGRLPFNESKMIQLYHGTTSAIVRSILKRGILPEGLTDNSMFHYTDYGRKGEPRHPNCVYLTNDLENAQRYAQNAVKHEGGFPIVLMVGVKSNALTWDDDAFYQHYDEFDFGERDINGNWIRKPYEELWMQSLMINGQCAHFGRISPDRIERIYVNGHWLRVRDFTRLYDQYTGLTIRQTDLSDKFKRGLGFYLKNLRFNVGGLIEYDLLIIERNVYAYDLRILGTMDGYQRIAACIRLMETIRDSIMEYGGTVKYTVDFRSRLGLNPELSPFAYVFGSFRVVSRPELLNDVWFRLNLSRNEIETLGRIVRGIASDDEFRSFYGYCVDFVGDVINYCKNVLDYGRDRIIKTLKEIRDRYDEAHDEIQSEIDYLRYNR